MSGKNEITWEKSCNAVKVKQKNINLLLQMIPGQTDSWLLSVVGGSSSLFRRCIRPFLGGPDHTFNKMFELSAQN